MTDRLPLGLLLLLLLPACTRVALHAEAPAVIDAPAAQSRGDLLAALNLALGQTPAPLAEDALTHDSLLLIERRRLNDRELTRPERFQLLKTGRRCVLLHERSGRRYELVHTRCRAL